jgi:hypothetical protein
MTATVNKLSCQIPSSNNYVRVNFFYGPTAQLGSIPPRFDASRSHTHTHTHIRQHSSVQVISPSQMPLHTKHTTNARYEHPCPQCDSNPRSQQSALYSHALERTATGNGDYVMKSTEPHYSLATCQLLPKPGKTIQATSH